MQSSRTTTARIGGLCWLATDVRALHHGPTRVLSSTRLTHHLGCTGVRDVLVHAVKYTELGSPGELRPKGKPDREADRTYGSKYELIMAATTWQELQQLFWEVQDNVDRNYGLVAHMLAQMSQVTDGAQLRLMERQQMLDAAQAMALVVRTNADKFQPHMLSSLLWALAGLELRDDLTIEALVLALRSSVGKYKAGELFHALAALALWGYTPPNPSRDKARLAAAEAAAAASLQEDAAPSSSKSASSRRKASGKSAAVASEAAVAAPRPVVTLIQAVQDRSIRAFRHLNLQDIANASYALSKLAVPGQLSREWLQGFAEASQPHLPMLRGEALASTAYLLARHGYKPKQAWIADLFRAVSSQLRSLQGRDFPMVLYSLARWRQPPPSKPWLDQLLAASYSSRALSLLPMTELAAVVTSLAALPGVAVRPAATAAAAGAMDATANPPATPVSQLWLVRLLPLLSSKVAQEGGEASPKLLASLFGALAALGAAPTADWVDEMLAACQDALPELAPAELGALVKAVAALGHVPDGIWTAAVCRDVAEKLPKVPADQLPVLLAAAAALEAQLQGDAGGSGDAAAAAAFEGIAAVTTASAGRWEHAAAAMPLPVLAHTIEPLLLLQQQGDQQSLASTSSDGVFLQQAVQGVLVAWQQRMAAVQHMSMTQLQATAADCLEHGCVPQGLMAAACAAVAARCREGAVQGWQELVAVMAALQPLQALPSTLGSSSSDAMQQQAGAALSVAAAAAVRCLVESKVLGDGRQVLQAATALRDEAGMQLDDAELELIVGLAGGEVTEADWDAYDSTAPGVAGAGEWWEGERSAAGPGKAAAGVGQAWGGSGSAAGGWERESAGWWDEEEGAGGGYIAEPAGTAGLQDDDSWGDDGGRNAVPGAAQGGWGRGQQQRRSNSRGGSTGAGAWDEDWFAGGQLQQPKPQLQQQQQQQQGWQQERW